MRHKSVVLAVLAAVCCGCVYISGKVSEAPRQCTLEPSTIGLRHIVLFRFKEGTPPDQIRAIEKALAELPQKIPSIKTFERGTEVSGRGLNQGFSHCAYMVFEDEAARDAYLDHPAHLAFAELAKPTLDQVFVFDYWVRR